MIQIGSASRGIIYVVDNETGYVQRIDLDAEDQEKLRIWLNARHGEKLRRERRKSKAKGAKA
jgi:hypothetical protein